jgi:TetR/AcrR family transcriptional regulator, mexJK operon transcriptional repressor
MKAAPASQRRATSSSFRAPQSRSAIKHAAILDAARSSFLAKGFDRSSMDEIALAASVSKPTVYKHFQTKERLFAEAIAAEVAAAEGHTQAMVDALASTLDLEADLRAFARRHLADVMHPDLLRMRRRLIGEAERFPELAATWFASGPEKAHRVLAGIFATLAERGLLRIDDPLAAAEHFNWLVLIPVNRAMFIPAPMTRAALHRSADRAVDAFLAAYQQRPAR